MDFKSIFLILFNLGQTMDSDDYGPCMEDRQTDRLVRMMGQNSEFWKKCLFWVLDMFDNKKLEIGLHITNMKLIRDDSLILRLCFHLNDDIILHMWFFINTLFSKSCMFWNHSRHDACRVIFLRIPDRNHGLSVSWACYHGFPRSFLIESRFETVKMVWESLECAFICV